MNQRTAARLTLGVVLVLLCTAMRILPHPRNLTPVGAVSLFSGACFDRKRWAFALVGVAAARVGGETRIALSGAAPVPWLLESLDAATPLPGTAYKVEIARALIDRAVAVL